MHRRRAAPHAWTRDALTHGVAPTQAERTTTPLQGGLHGIGQRFARIARHSSIHAVTRLARFSQG